MTRAFRLTAASDVSHLLQVMYMYYLLGYRLTRQCEEMIVAALRDGQVDDRNGWRLDRDEIVGSQIFEILDESVTRMVSCCCFAFFVIFFFCEGEIP